MTSGRTVAAVGSSESLVAQWSGGSAYPVALRQLLSEAEQQRHDRLRRSNDRRDYLAAHLLVRVLVRGLAVGAGLDHLDPASPQDVAALAAIEIEQRCPTCGRTGHGRPAVVRGPDVAVSWAHADGVVAAAVTPARTTAIGIDVERIGARSERAAGVSTSTWCRMECAVKAGLTDLDQVLAHGVPPTPGLCWTEHAVDLAGHLTQVTVLAPGEARVCPATPPGYALPMSDPTQTPATPSQLSDADKDVIRRGAFGAIALVSKADPGFFATFKESMAGSKALAKAPEQIRELLQGGLMAPPSGSPEQVESKILGDLKAAMAALASHPELQRGYREVLESAMNEVAGASKGVSHDEQAEIDRIRGVLDGSADTPGSAGA